LPNSSGLVGKYLMFNTFSVAGGTFEHSLNEYKRVEVTRILQDFYELDPKLGFYGGGGMDARFLWSPISFAASGLPPQVPQWGSEYKKALARNFTRSMYLAGHGTSLPLEDNSISLARRYDERRMGATGNARDLQGPSRQLEDPALFQ